MQSFLYENLFCLHMNESYFSCTKPRLHYEVQSNLEMNEYIPHISPGLMAVYISMG